MSQGFQVLLEAEKEASKIVQKARTYRVQRLKDSKSEAQKEIDDLKVSKQLEFLEIEKNFSGTNKEMVVTMKSQTEAAIEETRQLFAERKDLVIEKLLKGVVSVNPQIHKNAMLKMNK